MQNWLRRAGMLLILHSACCFCGNANAQSQQEWRDSVSVLSQQIERQPRNVELRLRKAAANIELGQWQYALDECSNVLDLEPANLAALYCRAFVNHHLGRYAFARKDYESVLLLAPLDRLSLIGLVLTNLEDKRLTEAYDGANRLVLVFPGDAMVYEVRSEVETALGMAEAALDDIQKAIEIEECTLKDRRQQALTVDDDMVSYQLSAFSINLSLGRRQAAKASLDYLVSRGIAKAQLDDYYKKAAAK